MEFAGGRKHTFEWGPKSIFAIPLNTKHRHFNGRGREWALLVSTTDMPLFMNLIHNEEFVFNNGFDFLERAGEEKYYIGEGDQVECEDQDPRIHCLRLEEMKKNCVMPKMDKFNITQ